MSGVLKRIRAVLETSDWIRERGGSAGEAERILAAAWREKTGELPGRAELLIKADAAPDEVVESAEGMARKRAEGALLQHVTGTEFFGEHEYKVDGRVLVPRPETEGMTLKAIEVLSGTPPRSGVEIGLGSGAISIELLARFPGLEMTATEITAEAIRVANENAGAILGEGARRLNVIRAEKPEHVLEPLGDAPGPYDFLISNPPYLWEGDPIEEEVIRHEPRPALFSPGDDALHFYRKIAEGADGLLAAGAPVFMETPSYRADEILRVFREKGWNAEVLEDLAGEPRVLVARKDDGG